MTYATQQDLIDRFGEEELIQRTDRAVPPTGQIDADVVGKALADADHMINGYARGRYRVPLDPAPEIICRMACDLARYFLFPSNPPESVRTNYEDARAALRDIAAGRLHLQAAGIEAATAEPSDVRFESAQPVFTRQSMEGF